MKKHIIKFRAMKDDMSDCSFVYGGLSYHKGYPRIHPADLVAYYSCLKGTEGQFINQYDSENEPIFEGDIIEFQAKWMDFKAVGVIEFGTWMAPYVRVINKPDDPNNCNFHIENAICGKIIGNIHQNKELLTIK